MGFLRKLLYITKNNYRILVIKINFIIIKKKLKRELKQFIFFVDLP